MKGEVYLAPLEAKQDMQTGFQRNVIERLLL